MHGALRIRRESELGTLSPLPVGAVVELSERPLAAHFGRGRRAAPSASNWAYLDAATELPASPHGAPLRLRQAVMIGLAGGLLYCALLLAIRIIRNATMPETVTRTTEARVAFYYATLSLAIVMQVGEAAVTAARVRRLGGLHGLFAGFVAGCVMTAGFLGLNLLFGGRAEPGFIWQVFTQIVNQGALWGLPAALLVSALAEWLRRPGRRAGAEAQLARAG